ncbi:tol-pal system YbgF family protein [Xenophilus sp. Marseille-Q4582]|uniref:tetratricopeptide repeat protein n=1 Tax=Xenophilus sp. Marseille-Q4582 TaxID=2866600 RepID=UPI001CE4A1ED|nr:hypothetical protein [Xenophilus sp. Marseille-Q4582]
MPSSPAALRPGPHRAASAERADERIPPFWQRLNSFFLFPLQLEPLLYAGFLALCSFGLMLGGLFMAAVLLGLVLAVSRYAFKVAALASRGVTRSADYRPHLFDEDWKWLPWKFLGVTLVHGFVIGLLAVKSPALGVAANLLSSFLIPATLMVLINTCSLRAAIHPFELLATVARVGKSYFLLCFFLFLLMQGAPMAAGLLAAVVPHGVLLPALTFVVIYFTWVMAAMVGYVMYQHHAALDIDPLMAPPGSAAAAAVPDPAAAEAQRRDAEVARLVQAGDMDEAVATAREWERVGSRGASGAANDLADARRYHRVLKVAERPEELGRHAQGFIHQLLQQQRAGEALEVWSACHKRVPQFRLASADSVLALAQHAWKATKARHVALLLYHFEKHFPQDARIPQAMELTVRALQQGLNDPERAVRIFMRMKLRYPEHASTQEAAWILRDELGPSPAGPASPA